MGLFTMVLKTTTLCFSIMMTISAYSQVLPDSAIHKTISLFSKDTINPRERIVLSENDSFIVYSTLAITVDNLKKFIAEYDIEEDKELQNQLLDTTKSHEQNMQDIHNDPRLMGRLEFITIALLEEGKCIVYNKISRSYVSQIHRTNYMKNWWTGVRYCTLDNQTIMDVRTGAF